MIRPFSHDAIEVWHYYTLQDVFKIYLGIDYYGGGTDTDLIEAIYNKVDYKGYYWSSNTALKVAPYANLLGNVFSAHLKDVVLITATDLDSYDYHEAHSPDEEAESLFYLTLASFIRILNETAPRYVPLYEAFNKQATDLLARLKNITGSVSKFNDTPQDPYSTTQDFSDDPYTTNVTRVTAETEIDPASLASRLDEIYRFMHKILKDWSREFEGLFTEGDVIQNEKIC